VLIQNTHSRLWDRKGVIESIGENRDYWVRVEGGGKLRRNRRFLRPDKTVEPRKSEVGKKAPPKEAVHQSAPEAEVLVSRKSVRKRQKPDRYQAGK
jgi:hypothetical protein